MPVRSCSVCDKSQSEDATILQCSRCQDRFYCGRECQLADWRKHRRFCGMPRKWYDKYRRCRDDNFHEGDLELITWPADFEGTATGWGHCALEDADALRAKFEGEFGGDQEKLLLYFPRAFRWTCCGTHAGMDWGCDHHGSGFKPCTCDFCHMGRPLPESIYYERTASRYGLHNLRRGPDLRSFQRA
ncbi:hypothetical protein BJ912DRAFT_980762, partial [Pholiota molesta]